MRRGAAERIEGIVEGRFVEKVLCQPAASFAARLERGGHALHHLRCAQGEEAAHGGQEVAALHGLLEVGDADATLARQGGEQGGIARRERVDFGKVGLPGHDGLAAGLEAGGQGGFEHFAFCTHIIRCHPLPQLHLQVIHHGLLVEQFLHAFEFYVVGRCIVVEAQNKSRVPPSHAERHDYATTRLCPLFEGGRQQVGVGAWGGEGKENIGEHEHLFSSTNYLFFLPTNLTNLHESLLCIF